MCDYNTDIISEFIYSIEWKDDYERKIRIWNYVDLVDSTGNAGNITIWWFCLTVTHHTKGALFSLRHIKLHIILKVSYSVYIISSCTSFWKCPIQSTSYPVAHHTKGILFSLHHIKLHILLKVSCSVYIISSCISFWRCPVQSNHIQLHILLKVSYSVYIISSCTSYP
jgi:hypothetical protein